MSRSGNLLVVDYDYFFPNPIMTTGTDTATMLLYDWVSGESMFTIGPGWHTRAEGFFRRNLPLPRCIEGYPEFWNRFTVDTSGLPLLACDSNLHAGRVFPDIYGLNGDGWEQVWLFDAHHDCGYQPHDELERGGQFGAANWMLVHHQHDSDLHVRYPTWRADADGNLIDIEKAPRIDVDRQIDDGKPVQIQFDAVVVCRSGGWVPSWCDDQFQKVLDAAPMKALWIDDQVDRTRTFDVEVAREMATRWKDLLPP